MNQIIVSSVIAWLVSGMGLCMAQSVLPGSNTPDIDRWVAGCPIRVDNAVDYHPPPTRRVGDSASDFRCEEILVSKTIWVPSNQSFRTIFGIALDQIPDDVPFIRLYDAFSKPSVKVPIARFEFHEIVLRINPILPIKCNEPQAIERINPTPIAMPEPKSDAPNQPEPKLQ